MIILNYGVFLNNQTRIEQLKSSSSVLKSSTNNIVYTDFSLFVLFFTVSTKENLDRYEKSVSLFSELQLLGENCSFSQMFT